MFCTTACWQGGDHLHFFCITIWYPGARGYVTHKNKCAHLCPVCFEFGKHFVKPLSPSQLKASAKPGKSRAKIYNNPVL